MLPQAHTLSGWSRMQSCNAGPSPSVSIGPSVPHHALHYLAWLGCAFLREQSGRSPTLDEPMAATTAPTLHQRLNGFQDIMSGGCRAPRPLQAPTADQDVAISSCGLAFLCARVLQTRHANDSLGPRVELLTSVGRNSDVILPSFPLSSSETDRCTPIAAFVADQCKSGRGKWALVGQILGFDSLAKRSRTLKDSRGL
jgi:hypothetical protein